MGKPKGDDDEKKATKDTVKIKPDLLKKCRALANDNDMSLKKYLEELLEPMINEFYFKMLEDRLAGEKRRRPEK